MPSSSSSEAERLREQACSTPAAASLPVAMRPPGAFSLPPAAAHMHKAAIAHDRNTCRHAGEKKVKNGGSDGHGVLCRCDADAARVMGAAAELFYELDAALLCRRTAAGGTSLGDQQSS